MPPTPRISLHAAIGDGLVTNGDLLLFRGRNCISRAIQVAGRGAYSHAAMVVEWDRQLFCCEVREWHGGRAVTLKSQVKRYPGLIDVFETNPGNRWPEYHPLAATDVIKQFAGRQYGWWGVLQASLYHLPFVRWMMRPPTDNAQQKLNDRCPPFCSQAIAIACNAGGVDPTPHLADRLTEPNDLARSPFFQKRVTLQ